jgi:hypothetical protein
VLVGDAPVRGVPAAGGCFMLLPPRRMRDEEAGTETRTGGPGRSRTAGGATGATGTLPADHFLSMAIFRVLASAAFGIRMVRMPFSKLARMSSDLTVRGSVKDRWNAP